MSGFITFQREAIEHPLFKGDPARLGAWFWLVAKACWKPTKFDIAGKIVTIERGQLSVSRSQLAKAWSMSESAVERFLTRLQTEQMIGRATGQGRSIITICNYSKYQDLKSEPGQATGQATGQPPDSHRTAKEQGNKGTIEEEPYGPSSTHTATKPKSASKVPKAAMLADWFPADLSGDVGAMIADWPDGRLDQEIAEFREYWIESGEKRPGWDRTFRSRIRTIHPRVMRDTQNGNNRNQQARGDEPTNPFVRAAAERQAERFAGRG